MFTVACYVFLSHNSPSILPPRPQSQLVTPLGRIILWTNRQPLALASGLVRHLDDINQLLLVVDFEVDLVVVARAKVDLDVLVAPEEHDRARVVQLVHGVEVGHALGVDRVHDRVVLDKRADLVKHFVLSGVRLGSVRKRESGAPWPCSRGLSRCRSASRRDVFPRA
jgi:hypothetical protein